MRKIVVCSSATGLQTAVEAIEKRGGRIIKSIPLAKSLVVDITSEDAERLKESCDVVRIEDDIRLRSN